MNSNFKKGMSFAEIICSIGLVATVLVVITGTLIGGLRAIQKSSGYNQASIIAHRIMEEYRNSDYSSIPIYPPASPDKKTEDNFAIETVIEEKTYGATSQKYKKVIVKVTREDRGEHTKRVEVIMEEYLIEK